ncbi:helix-turn-helix domain-containing protein [Bacillus paramycoides]|uniref:helix-turn-helix domain-containing protein n=1 Tax=Bacillus paramycoides TaxID=2026194 RepID=UPI003D0896A9
MYQVDLESLTRRCDISLTELAELSGIRQPNLSRIKRRRKASLGSIMRIAKALNIKDLNEIVKTQE